MEPKFDVNRELDRVVGPYEERPGERFWRRYGRWLGRAIAFAALAVAAAALVLGVLDKHVTDARKAPPPKKPVDVRILPAQP